MLETIGDGDEELLSVLLADQSCSCDTDSDSGGSSQRLALSERS